MFTEKVTIFQLVFLSFFPGVAHGRWCFCAPWRALSWPSVLPLARTSRLFELPFRRGPSETSAGTCPATGVVGHPCFGVIAFFIGKMAIIHIQQYKMMMWLYIIYIYIIIYVMWCKFIQYNGNTDCWVSSGCLPCNIHEGVERLYGFLFGKWSTFMVLVFHMAKLTGG